MKNYPGNKYRNKETETVVQTEESIAMESFFACLMAARNDLVSPNVSVIFIEGLAVMFCLIPWQYWEKQYVPFYIALLFGGVEQVYLDPYIRIKENNKQISIWNKLQYYPVDTWSIKKYLLKKAEGFTRKLFLVSLIIQLVVTIISCHTLAFGNVLYVFLVAYIYPMLLVVLKVVCDK